MSVFSTLFKKPKILKEVNGFFALIDGYTPVFTNYSGGVYEMELTRSCIHAGANHASKLSPAIQGADLKRLEGILNRKPNPFMTTSQFLYRTFTILEVSNTCYIIPILDKFDRTVGFYPLSPAMTEVLDVGGEPWLRFTMGNGEKAAIEFSRCGMVTKFQHTNDFKGEDNQALEPTMSLITTQNTGIEEGIKNSASFRFIAQADNFTKAGDLAKERKRFVDSNFAAEGSGGVLLFPTNYKNIQHIKSEVKIVDPEQMTLIQTRVFDYFGCNEDVLQNKLNGDSWAAYYEGKIEPFAIQLGEAMTAMTYSVGEMARDNKIIWASSRLQNMTNKDKLDWSVQMFDRGLASPNDVADVWNQPHTTDGDKRYIRREYVEVSKLDEQNNKPKTEVTPDANTGQQTVQSDDPNTGTGGQAKTN